MKRLTLIVLPSLLLAGCGDDQPQGGGDGRNASGEVLEGSISDAMIPLDQLKSQAPPAKPEPQAGSCTGAAADAAENAPAVASESAPVNDGAAADPVGAALAGE